MTRLKTHLYDARSAIDRGASRPKEALWYLVKMIFFLSAAPWPSRLRVRLLNLFGAKVSGSVYIKPRVNIHMPWRLEIREHAMIGEEVFILNFEQVTIGAHSCISQRAFLCTGSHDYKDPLFPYRNGPIEIGDGAWVGAQVFVGPNVKIDEECVVTAGSIASHSLPKAMVCSGNPCKPTRERWKS